MLRGREAGFCLRGRDPIDVVGRLNDDPKRASEPEREETLERPPPIDGAAVCALVERFDIEPFPDFSAK